MMVYSASSGGGAELRGSVGGRVQMQGCRRVIIALLVVVSTAIAHVHCITGTAAPAPAPKQRTPVSFNQDEADALNAIFENWTAKGLNQELITILNWTATASSLHPCNISDKLNNVSDYIMYEGAWSGLGCTPKFNSSTVSYDVSVTWLQVVGNNASCNNPVSYFSSQCGFNGVKGVLPSAISKLVNLYYLDLSNNDLSGNLPMSPEGNLFSSSLFYMDLSNNHFSGTFSAGARFNPMYLYLSNNDFTSIRFANYTGPGAETDSASNMMPFLGELSIANNKLSGPFPTEVFQMESLTSLDLSGNNLSGSIILSNTQWNSILQYLNIQNNNFSGAFPSQILKSPQLQEIYGDYNQYDALHLPNIGPFTNSTLSIVSLTNNKIEVVQYADKGSFTTLNLLFSNQLFLEGNPMCQKIENQLLSTICRMNQTSPPLTVLSKPNPKTKIIIALSTSGAFIFILMTILYVWRLMLKIRLLHSILAEFEKNDVKPNLYSYKEIKLATKNFDIGNKLGEGGFGIVYKGELFDGSMVAVKKLTISSKQGLPEFLNEVVVISGLKHRNLVKLKGCCFGDGNQRMLVFEYVENKNLGEALWIQGELHEIVDHPYLDWTTRYNIIMGIARGLAYLHEDLQSPVIHRDIKATNILLDKNYNPKIADFGLAYLFPVLDNDETHFTLGLEQIAGTRGYCSPEYMLHGHMSTALDVYSFGIMILEIVSGRKNIDRQKSNDEVYLRDWAWKQFEAHASMTLIDPKMKYSPLDLADIIRIINVALACAQYKAAKRPVMYDVVLMLLGNMPISGFSKSFDEDECGDVAVNLSNTTSSVFMENNNFSVDECSLLGNNHEVEMSTMAL